MGAPTLTLMLHFTDCCIQAILQHTHDGQQQHLACCSRLQDSHTRMVKPWWLQTRCDQLYAPLVLCCKVVHQDVIMNSCGAALHLVSWMLRARWVLMTC